MLFKWFLWGCSSRNLLCSPPVLEVRKCPWGRSASAGSLLLLFQHDHSTPVRYSVKPMAKVKLNLFLPHQQCSRHFSCLPSWITLATTHVGFSLAPGPGWLPGDYTLGLLSFLHRTSEILWIYYVFLFSKPQGNSRELGFVFPYPLHCWTFNVVDCFWAEADLSTASWIPKQVSGRLTFDLLFSLRALLTKHKVGTKLVLCFLAQFPDAHNPRKTLKDFSIPFLLLLTHHHHH